MLRSLDRERAHDGNGPICRQRSHRRQCAFDCCGQAPSLNSAKVALRLWLPGRDDFDRQPLQDSPPTQGERRKRLQHQNLLNRDTALTKAFCHQRQAFTFTKPNSAGGCSLDSGHVAEPAGPSLARLAVPACEKPFISPVQQRSGGSHLVGLQAAVKEPLWCVSYPQSHQKSSCASSHDRRWPGEAELDFQQPEKSRRAQDRFAQMRRCRSTLPSASVKAEGDLHVVSLPGISLTAITQPVNGRNQKCVAAHPCENRVCTVGCNERHLCVESSLHRHLEAALTRCTSQARGCIG